jgi:hypothetical protein
MGRGLGGDARAALFGAADDVDGEFRRDVLQVDVRAGVFGKYYVAGDDEVFGGVGPSAEAEAGGDDALVHHGTLGHGSVLAVIHDGQVEHLGVFDGAAHEFVVLDAVAVVGDGDDAGAFERADGGEGLALHADGDAAGGENFHDGVAANGVVDVLDGAGVVGDGRRVGHAHDGGEPAGGGGAGAGGDGFLMRLAGLAEVDVDVDEAGAGDEAGGVDFLRGLFLRGGERRGEAAVDDEEVAGGVALGGRVDDAGVLDPEGGHERESFSFSFSRVVRVLIRENEND